MEAAPVFAQRRFLCYAGDMVCRRRFLVSAGGILCAGGACAGLAGVREPLDLRVERVDAAVEGLPLSLEGFRIVALSDFHLYPFTRIGLVKTAVAMANSLKPDLVVLLGDFVDATADAIEELAPVLATLNAVHGVFGVLGNHDHLKGADVVRSSLERRGIGVLVNGAVELAAGGAGLHVAGTDSLCGRFHLGRALARVPSGAPVILLAHEPDVADSVAEDGRVGLQLSGHSHGGQVRLAGMERFFLPRGGRKYAFGSYRVGGMFVHTSRGIGTTGVPLRIGSPPEVTELVLRRSPAAEGRLSCAQTTLKRHSDP